MSATRLARVRLPSDLPPLAWWLLAVSLIAVAVFGDPLVATIIGALVIVMRARPFDFLTSYLMVVVIGSFMNYGAGTLTYEMTIYTFFLVFMLYCYVLSRRWDSLSFPKTPVFTPMILFAALTFINFLRGLVIGNKPQYAGLELIAMLALLSSLIVANRRLSPREIKVSLVVISIMALMHFMLGVWVFSIIHSRAIGVYFNPVTGVVAVLMFNFALRQRTKMGTLMWMLALAPPLVHQFLSFTRGYWMALIGSVAYSLIVFVWKGPGVGARLRQGSLVLLLFVGMGVLGVLVLSAAVGVGHLLDLAGSRFASSAGTTYTWESSSNVVRLNESFHVLDQIIQKPIFGHGLGYSFVIREPIEFKLYEQWFVHEEYLLVTLKQGLLGLGLWLWLLFAILRTGFQGRNLPNLTEQAWCMGTSTMIVYILIYSFVHFPLAEINTTFPVAFATGVTMGFVGKDRIALRWKGRRTLSAGAE